MFRSKKDTSGNSVQWQHLTAEPQLEELVEQSKSNPVLIFKHSTRCGISHTALDRLEREWTQTSDRIHPYYLDLLAYRGTSNAVAERFRVQHESPQVILIQKGAVVYHASHTAISVAEMMSRLAA